MIKKYFNGLNLSLVVIGAFSLFYLLCYKLWFININGIYSNARIHGELIYDLCLAIFTGVFVYILTSYIPQVQKQKRLDSNLLIHCKNICEITHGKVYFILNTILQRDRNSKEDPTIQDIIRINETDLKISEEQEKIIRHELSQAKRVIEEECNNILRIVDADHILYPIVMNFVREKYFDNQIETFYKTLETPIPQIFNRLVPYVSQYKLFEKNIQMIGN